MIFSIDYTLRCHLPQVIQEEEDEEEAQAGGVPQQRWPRGHFPAKWHNTTVVKPDWCITIHKYTINNTLRFPQLQNSSQWYSIHCPVWRNSTLIFQCTLFIEIAVWNYLNNNAESYIIRLNDKTVFSHGVNNFNHVIFCNIWNPGVVAVLKL